MCLLCIFVIRMASKYDCQIIYRREANLLLKGQTCCYEAECANVTSNCNCDITLQKQPTHTSSHFVTKIKRHPQPPLHDIIVEWPHLGNKSWLPGQLLSQTRNKYEKYDKPKSTSLVNTAASRLSQANCFSYYIRLSAPLGKIAIQIAPPAPSSSCVHGIL